MMCMIEPCSMVDIDNKCGYLDILTRKKTHVYGVKLRPIDDLQMCRKQDKILLQAQLNIKKEEWLL